MACEGKNAQVVVWIQCTVVPQEVIHIAAMHKYGQWQPSRRGIVVTPQLTYWHSFSLVFQPQAHAPFTHTDD